MNISTKRLKITPCQKTSNHKCLRGPLITTVWRQQRSVSGNPPSHRITSSTSKGYFISPSTNPGESTNVTRLNRFCLDVQISVHKYSETPRNERETHHKRPSLSSKTSECGGGHGCISVFKEQDVFHHGSICILDWLQTKQRQSNCQMDKQQNRTGQGRIVIQAEISPLKSCSGLKCGYRWRVAFP